MRGHANHPPNTWVARVDIIDQGFAKDVCYSNFLVDTHAAGTNVEVPPIGVDIGTECPKSASLLVRIQSRTSFNRASLLVRDAINVVKHIDLGARC